MLFVGLGFYLFPSSGTDDIFITYAAADILADTGQLLNYNGERLEQSSSLLSVLLFATLHRLTGVSLQILGPILSVTAACGALIAVYPLAERIQRGSGSVTSVLLATQVYFLYWAWGKLESTLVACLLLLLILTWNRLLEDGLSKVRISAAVLVSAAFILVRPETLIVALCLLIAVLAAIVYFYRIKPTGDRQRLQSALRRWAVLLGIVLVCGLLLFAFRKLYFDSWFPQPVAAKVGGVSDSFPTRQIEGILYIVGWLFAWTPSLVPSLVSALVLAGYVSLVRQSLGPRFNIPLLLTVAAMFAYLAYVIGVGGDWMPGARFLAFIVPLLAVALTFPVMLVMRANQNAGVVFTAALVTAQIYTAWLFATTRFDTLILPVADRYDQHIQQTAFDAPTYTWFERVNRRHIRDMPLSHYLGDITAAIQSQQSEEPVTIFTGQMGFIPYNLYQQNPSVVYVDSWGLASTHLLDCPLLGTAAVLDLSLALLRSETQPAGCDLPEIDIIYDLILNTDAVTFTDLYRDIGYVVVYLQVDDINFVGGVGSMFIAVHQRHQAVVAEVDIPETISFADWLP